MDNMKRTAYLKGAIIIVSFFLIALLVDSAIRMNAYERLKDHFAKIEWEEEVMLYDGTVINTRRLAVPISYSSLGGTSWWDVKKIELEIISDNVIDKPKVWNVKPFVPLILDYDHENNHWLVIASWYSGRLGDNLGNPKYPYKQWNYIDGAWLEVDLDLDYEWLPTNLVSGIDKEGMPNMDIEFKTEKFLKHRHRRTIYTCIQSFPMTLCPETVFILLNR